MIDKHIAKEDGYNYKKEEEQLKLTPEHFTEDRELYYKDKKLKTRKVRDDQGNIMYQFKRDGDTYWTIHTGLSNFSNVSPKKAVFNQYTTN